MDYHIFLRLHSATLKKKTEKLQNKVMWYASDLEMPQYCLQSIIRQHQWAWGHFTKHVKAAQSVNIKVFPLQRLSALITIDLVTQRLK